MHTLNYITINAILNKIDQIYFNILFTCIADEHMTHIRESENTVKR